MNAYTHTHIYINTYKLIYTYVHICNIDSHQNYTRIHTYVHHIHTPAYIHIHTHMYISTHQHIYTYTYIYVHIYYSNDVNEGINSEQWLLISFL